MTEEVKWRCDFCSEVVQKLPPKTKHWLRQVKVSKKKSSKKSTLSKVLSRTTFNLKDDQIICSSSSLKLSVQLCPKFEIPMPVKVFTDPSELNIKPVEIKVEQNVEQQNDSPMKKSPLKKIINNSLPTKFILDMNNYDLDLHPDETELTPKKQQPKHSSSKKSAKLNLDLKQKSILCYFNAKS